MVENQWTYAKELSKLAAQFFNSTFISNIYFTLPHQLLLFEKTIDKRSMYNDSIELLIFSA